MDEGIIKRFRLSAENKFLSEHQDLPGPSSPRPPPKPVVRRRQVFELYDPDVSHYLGIEDNSDAVLKFIREWFIWRKLPSSVTRGCEEHIREAQASVSSQARISSQQTELMAWEPYAETQTEELSYHKKYFVRAKAHAHEYFLDFVPGMLSDINLIHLSEKTGQQFHFENADDRGKEGYVEEGDIVYFCVGDKSIHAMARGVITLGWEPKSTSTPPWRLKYHAKGIDSR